MKNKGINPIAILVIIIIVAAAVVGVYFMFIKGGKYSTPEDTIHTYANAMNNRDADTIYESLSSEVREDVTKSEVQTFLDFWENLNMKVEINSVDVEISGDTATAQIESTLTAIDPETGEEYTETSTDNDPLVKEEGEWKLDEWG